MQFLIDNATRGAIGENTVIKTYNPFEMLGANFQRKSSRVTKEKVHDIDSNTKDSMQIAWLTKQVALR